MGSFFSKILISLVIISATIHIWSDYKKRTFLTYIFKPLTMVLIILICLFATQTKYRNLILIGLFFSLAGDIFLMLNSTHFTKGLFAFLIAHIFYIAAIINNTGLHLNIFVLLPLAVYFLLMYRIIITNMGNKKLYVIIYSVIIIFLLWLALSTMFFDFTKSSLLLGLGIFLFTFSDTILAYNRFVKKLKIAQLLILTFYYSAQLLLVSSVLYS